MAVARVSRSTLVNRVVCFHDCDEEKTTPPKVKDVKITIHINYVIFRTVTSEWASSFSPPQALAWACDVWWRCNVTSLIVNSCRVNQQPQQTPRFWLTLKFTCCSAFCDRFGGFLPIIIGLPVGGGRDRMFLWQYGGRRRWNKRWMRVIGFHNGLDAFSAYLCFDAVWQRWIKSESMKNNVLSLWKVGFCWTYRLCVNCCFY